MVHPRVLDWHDDMEREALVDQMYVDDVSEAMDGDEMLEAFWT
jgi:hypothetical protein